MTRTAARYRKALITALPALAAALVYVGAPENAGDVLEFVAIFLGIPSATALAPANAPK